MVHRFRRPVNEKDSQPIRNERTKPRREALEKLKTESKDPSDFLALGLTLLKEPLEFVRCAPGALINPQAFLEKLDSLAPAKRRAKIRGMLTGSLAGVALLASGAVLFDQNLSWLTWDKGAFFALWLAVALLLHAGLVVTALPGRLLARTLELSAIWFSLTIFGVSCCVTLLYLGTKLGANRVNGLFELAAKCSPDPSCAPLISDAYGGNASWILLSGLAWFLGIAASIFVALAYANAYLARGYQVTFVRSAFSLVTACLMACLVVAAAVLFFNATYFRDSLIMAYNGGWASVKAFGEAIDVRTAKEKQAFLKSRNFVYEREMARARVVYMCMGEQDCDSVNEILAVFDKHVVEEKNRAMKEPVGHAYFANLVLTAFGASTNPDRKPSPFCALGQRIALDEPTECPDYAP